MDWDYSYGEGWGAFSEQNDDGDRFEWRITVNCDGEFLLDESDSELTDRKAPFNSLAEAKAFCQASEDAWWGKAHRAKLAAAQAEFDKQHAEASAQQRKDDEARDELDRALPQ